jgi:hypothetical protein
LLRGPDLALAGSAGGFLLTTELLYRLWSAPGIDQPFVPGHNFGSFVDLALFGRLSEGNWATFTSFPRRPLSLQASWLSGS